MKAHVKTYMAIIGLIVSSCLHGTGNDFSVKYKFTGMNVQNAHNLGEIPAATAADSIPANTFAMQANMTSEVLAEGDASPDIDHPPENTNRIDSVSIISDADFGPGLPAGSELNDNFYFYMGDYFTTSSTVPYWPISVQKHEEYVQEGVPQRFDIMLMVPPPTPSTHIFTIRMYLNDGTILIDSTNSVNLY